MRRAGLMVAAAVTAVAVQAAPAHADSTVVVRGLDFSGGLTSLAITGCPGLFDRVAEPISTYLSKAADVPLGSRALKYDLAGGNAVGAQHAVASMTGTTVAGMSVQAPQGTTGVAYAGYQSPADYGTNLVWVGRADLTAAAGGWQQVDATGLTYTWTQYDLAAQRPAPLADAAADAATAEAPATVDSFVAAHGGDGPGFWTVGFGCDGNPFKVDALRVGTPGNVTTYDLEGYTSRTAIGGSRSRVAPGDGVTLRGTLRDERGAALPHGLLVLESQPYGASGFSPVEGATAPVDGGDPTVTVEPTTHTVYRWRFAGTWSVDGSVSPTFTVDVATLVDAALDVSGGAGQPLAVAGGTNPPQPGVRATLWEVTPHGRAEVAHTVVGKDGRYSFEVPEGHTGRFVVTVPAAHGNLAGQSPVVLVRALQR
ncbi:hypothetical protein H5V45_07365 [Nocardioides sp. KIGAM211]|uniref:Uncharacterized protein n=1 Tax=Nocardioides luti TaxID=2761101 RepID=A0A7X0RF98_9ACTN|nr:hypothetical protein [Nocardioides luti]MBB6627137.1 hypothetical protein [Nocardioides luti]